MVSESLRGSHGSLLGDNPCVFTMVADTPKEKVALWHCLRWQTTKIECAIEYGKFPSDISRRCTLNYDIPE
jgi:hypothetical protein